jgi:hypothetical protein
MQDSSRKDVKRRRTWYSGQSETEKYEDFGISAKKNLNESNAEPIQCQQSINDVQSVVIANLSDSNQFLNLEYLALQSSLAARDKQLIEAKVFSKVNFHVKIAFNGRINSQ